MVDERFRRQLDGELDRWVAQGWIDDQQRDRLRQVYKLDRLNLSSSGRFISILMVIGALLVGLGLITFVAANWGAIPRGVRAVTALVLMVGLQTVGFVMWRDPERIPGVRAQSPQRLGSALILMGGLAFGGTIALMAQWVQIGGSASGLFWIWSVGVIAMAYGIRHTPSGFLGIVLWLCGFWVEMTTNGFGGSDLEALSLPYSPGQFALTTLVGVMPLAYWCRSRWIFVTGLIALIISLGWLWPGVALGGLPVLAMIWPGIVWGGIWAWSFWHDRCLPWLIVRLTEETEDQDEQRAGLDLAPIAQLFALVGLIGLLYGLGFSWWNFDRYWDWQDLAPSIELNWGLLWFPLVVFLAFSGATIGLWISNLRVQRILPQRIPSETKLLDRTFGICCLGVIGLGLCYRVIDGGSGLQLLRLIGSNLALFGLGTTITWEGLQQARRWRFWLGLLTLTMLVITRFFEYPTGLLMKSVVLICCGLGVIFAGLRFERIHAQAHRRAISTPSSDLDHI